MEVMTDNEHFNLSRKEAAAYYHVTTATIDRWIREGILEAYQPVKWGKVYIPRGQDVRKFERRVARSGAGTPERAGC